MYANMQQKIIYSDFSKKFSNWIIAGGIFAGISNGCKWFAYEDKNAKMSRRFYPTYNHYPWKIVKWAKFWMTNKNENLYRNIVATHSKYEFLVTVSLILFVKIFLIKLSILYVNTRAECFRTLPAVSEEEEWGWRAKSNPGLCSWDRSHRDGARSACLWTSGSSSVKWSGSLCASSAWGCGGTLKAIICVVHNEHLWGWWRYSSSRRRRSQNVVVPMMGYKALGDTDLIWLRAGSVFWV